LATLAWPTERSFDVLRAAALDPRPITGLTHRFYRYPARFSPAFAAAAIEEFSSPGALVLDAYLGGATTMVEAVVRRRRAVGSDINSLAIFIARVKTTPLDRTERAALVRWATRTVPSLLYSDMPNGLDEVMSPGQTKNMTLPVARPIKKVLALALLTLGKLPSQPAQDFARCALLNAGQWALNGVRKRPASLTDFRTRLSASVLEMLDGLAEFQARVGSSPLTYLINDSATNLKAHAPFTAEKADLVVTSPPYPGIHMLYHRWQVDGRRETPAPYWLAACKDGEGPAFYNFADRSSAAAPKYFAESLKTLKGIREVTKDGAFFVQMIAFGDPAAQLARYLGNMERAGFEEVRPSAGRILRQVPSRRWHANFKGALNAAKEVVLVHRAI